MPNCKSAFGGSARWLRLSSGDPLYRKEHDYHRQHDRRIAKFAHGYHPSVRRPHDTLLVYQIGTTELIR